MNTDLINRHDLIKAIKPDDTALSIIMKIIQLPQASTENINWVSVTERIPKEKGSYYCSYIDGTNLRTGVLYFGEPSLFAAEHYPEGLLSLNMSYGFGTTVRDTDTLAHLYKVIEWMELPTPSENAIKIFNEYSRSLYSEDN